MNKPDNTWNEEKFKAIAKQLRQPQGDAAIQVAQSMNENNRFINLFTIEALEVMPNDNLLEVGMGNGFFVKDILASDTGVRYSGCDYSEIMVDEARKNNEQLIKEGRAEFIVGEADKLPFGDNVFDKAFTINTVYFWEKPANVLAEFHRVLKDQGILFLSLRPKSSMKDYPFVNYGFDMYSRPELTALLSQNRFSVVNYWEKEEPSQEFNGKIMKVETLIVAAKKESQALGR